jgi:RND family efflux transporter MFP subunit
MKLFFRILVPVSILMVTVLTVRWLMATRPAPMMRTPPPTVQAVDATRLTRTDYQVYVRTQGRVRPRTQSTLKPEVAGRVVAIAPNFRDGGFFEEGDVLLEIDPRDYEAAIEVAEARLLRAEAGRQLAKLDHERNLKVFAESLISEAEVDVSAANLAQLDADVASAKAQLDQAQRDLARTKLRAPYAGRVQSYSVDVGQYVSPGNELASIFAVDYVEIRMPIPNDAIDFLELPEDYRNTDDRERVAPRVFLTGDYGSREVTWEGRLVRADGAYDVGTTELFVVAQVDDPYAQKAKDNPPLKVGQFVTARIEGAKLKDVFIIPRSATRSGNEVLVVDNESTIRRREVTILTSDEENYIVRDGLQEGEILCTTPMRFAADGAKVVATVDGVAPKPQGPPKDMGSPPGAARSGKPGMAKPADDREKKS